MYFNKLLVCFVSVLLQLCCPVWSQPKLTFYDVLNAVPFNGSNDTIISDGCNIPNIQLDVLECLPMSKLNDDIIKPVEPISSDVTKFFAFGRQSPESGEIQFTFNESSNLSVTLHFFNSPDQLIGLPTIQLMTTGLVNVSYTFDNNDDLSQTDSEIRNVTLHLDLSQFAMGVNFVLMSFNFDDTNIDWFLISEVDFNFDPFDLVIDPITFQDDPSIISFQPDSMVSIPCTVANNGYFVWQWKYNGEDSLPTNNQIQMADATRTSILVINNSESTDFGNYSCTVSHQNDSSNIYTRNISLVIQVIDSSSISSTTTSSTSSSLINPTSSSLSPSSSTLPSSSNNNILPIGIGVAFGILFLILAIVVVILLIVLCSRKKHKMIKTINNENELKDIHQGINTKDSELTYSVVKKGAPEIPPQNFNPAEVDLGNETKPRLECNPAPPKLAKVSNLNNFNLVDNPVYVEESIPDTSIPNTSIPIGTQETYYSSADYATTQEAMYSEIPENSINEVTYSTPEYFDFKNPLYNENDNNKDQLFSFVSSSDYSDGAIYSVPEKVNKRNTIIKISPSSLQEIKHLGLGQFGEVVLAKTIGLSLIDLGLSKSDDDRNISMNVAVKKIKMDAEDTSLLSFEKEMKFMSHLIHRNVVQLLAVSEDGSDPFMVIEYMLNGDLNQFLLQHNISNYHPPNNREELSPQNLLSMAIQVASGMSYLASHNYIHRDLATRNCLVGEDNVIKIADFGLSRSLYDSVYYRVKGKAKMPIRWMATECFYGKFSQFSDVWAYGVTVWEIYTMAREPPYPTLDDQQILDDALNGANRLILTRPSFCPKEVYEYLRTSCFTADYRRRATFSTVHSQLLKIEKTLYD